MSGLTPGQINEWLAKNNREFMEVLASIEKTVPGRERYELVTLLTELGDVVEFSNDEWEAINARMAKLPTAIQ